MATNQQDVQPLAGDPLAAPDFQTVNNTYSLTLAETLTPSDGYPTVLGNFLLVEVITGVQDTIRVIAPVTISPQDVQALAADPLAAPDFPDVPPGTSYNVSWTDTLTIVESYAHRVSMAPSLTEIRPSPSDTLIPTYGPLISMADMVSLTEVWVVSTSHATFPSFGRGVRLPWVTRAIDKLRMG